jgi:hypothetical protein
MRIINKILYALLFIIICQESARSQFTLSAQIRTRSELRDGQGAPLPKGADPSFFLSQRTRLNGLFSMYRLKVGLSVQDVRVWGQDVSTINRTTSQDNNGIMVHEAWAEILLSDTSNKKSSLNLKIGRQELIYDDQRLIGNLDWLQQGRRHDAALLKYLHKDYSVHVGAAYNQNKEGASGTIYNATPAGNYAATTNGGVMYKSLQFLYAGKKFKQGNASFLFFSDQFSKYSTETVEGVAVKTFVPGVWSKFTTGFYYNNIFNRISLSGSAYRQFGKNNSGQGLNASMFTIAGGYQLGKLNAGAGFDYTSKSFDPLYGTPHKFWGLMDYFYAGSGFGRNGLLDYYARLKYKTSPRLLLNADVHHFASATAADNGRKKFGEEIDLVATFEVTKQILVEGGYSHFFNTTLLTSPSVKNIQQSKPAANWAYVMINIKPELLFK